MRILEVGCGAGATLSTLRDSGAIFSGVDYSAPHIEIAAAALPGMNFHVSEAAALPFPDASFHAAFSYGVFLYFPDASYASKVLGEMLRVLHPDGRILILDVPDAAKRLVCETARRAAGAALNPPHCYYPKDFFEQFASASGRCAERSSQAVPVTKTPGSVITFCFEIRIFCCWFLRYFRPYRISLIPVVLASVLEMLFNAQIP